MKPFKISMLSISAAALVIASIPGPVTHAAKGSTQQEQAQDMKFSDLDPKIQETAKKWVTDLSGKNMEFARVLNQDGVWVIESKDGKSQLSIIKKTGEMEYVNIFLTFDQLDDTWKNKAMTALKNMAGEREFKVERVDINRHANDKETRTSMGGKGFAVSFTDSSQVVTVEYPIKEVDRSVLQTVEQALKQFTGGTAHKLTSATRYDININDPREQADIWSLWGGDKKQSLYVQVGAKTGKVTQISVTKEETPEKDKAYGSLKADKVKAAAAPAAKKMFGIDLKDYAMEQTNRYENHFVFAKKGSPTLEARIDLKGNCYSLAVKPANGKVE
ncbi:hypothetical protein LQV63_10160 [Paenibacillus profundus]|uniref:PepSY domain-containing protein n=1 Tax=Paenibacillus profundus TaxID=1173085 RepID=A0ABS8YF41_9BACL|nr:hypothetical protein [Paenibacillus profundus]MCE5169677.1 hypothetical protein [Paenibacillus profundus]